MPPPQVARYLIVTNEKLTERLPRRCLSANPITHHNGIRAWVVRWTYFYRVRHLLFPLRLSAASCACRDYRETWPNRH